MTDTVQKKAMTPREVVEAQVAAFNRNDRAGFVADYNETDAHAAGGWYDAVKEGFPSSTCALGLVAEQDSVVAGELILTGTQTGPIHWPSEWDEAGVLANVPPTGRSIEVKFGFVSKVENGVIVYDNPYGFLSGVAQALGC